MKFKDFLDNSVFYPCAGLDGDPFRYLGAKQGYSKFFCVDHCIKEGAFLSECRNRGFFGYDLTECHKLDPETLFDCTWGEILEMYGIYRNIKGPFYENIMNGLLDNPFIYHLTFTRQNRYTPTHGPDKLELVFAKCEAIVAYKLSYLRLSIPPACLVYIRPGLAFGDNFNKFNEHLAAALKSNSSGLPHAMFHYSEASQSDSGYYWPFITENYINKDKYTRKPTPFEKEIIYFSKLKVTS